MAIVRTHHPLCFNVTMLLYNGHFKLVTPYCCYSGTEKTFLQRWSSAIFIGYLKTVATCLLVLESLVLSVIKFMQNICAMCNSSQDGCDNFSTLVTYTFDIPFHKNRLKKLCKYDNICKESVHIYI